jgi:hypothetical protein
MKQRLTETFEDKSKGRRKKALATSRMMKLMRQKETLARQVAINLRLI